MKKKSISLARTFPALLLCLLCLIPTAHADMGPKPELTVTLVNAPEGTLYIDLLAEGTPRDMPYDQSGLDQTVNVVTQIALPLTCGIIGMPVMQAAFFWMFYLFLLVPSWSSGAWRPPLTPRSFRNTAGADEWAMLSRPTSSATRQAISPCTCCMSRSAAFER